MVARWVDGIGGWCRWLTMARHEVGGERHGQRQSKSRTRRGFRMGWV